MEDGEMRNTIFPALVLLTTFGFVGPARPPVPPAEKLKADEVVTKHLDAIGTPQARAAIKSLLVEGNMHVRFLRGGMGEAGGPLSLISAGHKFSFRANLNISNYPGEFFAFDGEKKSIGYLTPGRRSQLEDFLNNNGEIVQEGLIGGVLSTAWPLYDWRDRKAKLDSDGLKKEEGKDLYRLRYKPRHEGGNLKIYLFFDPETFRHVKTIYTEQVAPSIGTGPELSASEVLTRLTLEETFGGFTNVNGLMLPSQWMLKYSSEGTGYGAFIIEYDMAVGRIQPNVDVSRESFQVQQ
jgi:hypothetical protein